MHTYIHTYIHTHIHSDMQADIHTKNILAYIHFTLYLANCIGLFRKFGTLGLWDFGNLSFRLNCIRYLPSRFAFAFAFSIWHWHLAFCLFQLRLGPWCLGPLCLVPGASVPGASALSGAGEARPCIFFDWYLLSAFAFCWMPLHCASTFCLRISLLHLHVARVAGIFF